MSDGFSFFGVSFATPWVLWLLLIIPVVSFLRGKIGGTPAVIFSSTKVLEAVGSRRQSRVGDFLAALCYFGLASLIVGLARPQLGKTITQVQASGVDIMLVLDMSRSMLTEDFTIGSQRANRVEAVKQVTEKFIDARPSDRIGIVAFAGRPYLISPLTLDHDWLSKNLDRLRVGMVEDGTAIGSAIAAASNRLKDKKAKSKLIVLLSDGENNAGRVMPLTAAEAAKALGIRVYTVGAGARGLAPYPMQDPFGRKGYVNVKADFDETTLKDIATMTGAQYFRATDTKSLQNIFNEIDQLEKSKIEVQKIAQYTDLFAWFVGVGLICIVLENLLSQTIWRRLP